MAKLVVTMTVSGVGDPLGGPQTFEQDGLVRLGPVAVAYASPNKEVDLFIKKVGLEVLWITADRACTIKVNDSGSPTDTINVPAGSQGFAWTKNMQSTNPLNGGDATKFYLTNNAAFG